MATAHQSALEAKHAAIEARLTAEQSRPHPDGPKVAMLKKQKLRLKDEMLAH